MIGMTHEIIRHPEALEMLFLHRLTYILMLPLFPLIAASCMIVYGMSPTSAIREAWRGWRKEAQL
jgi:hypothetical protein